MTTHTFKDFDNVRRRTKKDGPFDNPTFITRIQNGIIYVRTASGGEAIVNRENIIPDPDRHY